ncbi:hypothetical protein V7S43_014322 [Phytophthora oleae]|uniref:RxLR effector protein n=1 Tax=Phytophthora oleae TaxID=2107226 RepID=A0ABD3F245_9STRA
MKTSSSILVTMALLALAVLSAPGGYAYSNPITNHAHVPDPFLTYPFQTPVSSKKTPKHPHRQYRALRWIQSPKQDQLLDDGNHQPHDLTVNTDALSEKIRLPMPPVPTTSSNLKAQRKLANRRRATTTTAMNSSGLVEQKTRFLSNNKTNSWWKT